MLKINYFINNKLNKLNRNTRSLFNKKMLKEMN